ncbi:glycerate kinase [Arthrobacter sp. YN]|uniref:glycerate kinase n=1 Tax=Arthrobacter sp. YN TaxID=2020486 RepID=UPI000B5F93C3|nr:glycerate kinase [Arthrobacter sp. YN]ASN20092.1 glycerate kinase [Arthrobacter sp. YN]
MKPERPAWILIAPDSFKGSATADAVARSVARGWSTVRPDDHIQLAPMADGGEGTLDALAPVFPRADRRTVTITGPDDCPAEAEWLYIPAPDPGAGSTGVVELSSTSGITLMQALAAKDAHSKGFGQAIAAALDAGVTRLILGIGGSACTDGGAGMLQELGYRILDSTGCPIGPGNSGAGQSCSVDTSQARPLPKDGVVVLTDVTNPLTGPNGSAAVFGPQKGAQEAEIEGMDAALSRFAALFAVDPLTSGSGAGGGTGFGLMVWGGKAISGSEHIADVLELPTRIKDANLLITGEGRFDEQSGFGKVVGKLRQLAQPTQVPVALVAGSISVSTAGFSDSVALTALAGTAHAAMADPEYYLVRAGAQLASNFTRKGQTQTPATQNP